MKNLRDEMEIPLLVSGNLFTVEDCVKAMEITHADGVMLARGAMGNPTLINNLNHYFNNEEMESSSLIEQERYCEELLKDLIDEKGEDIALRVARGIVTKFFDGFPNSKKLKAKLSSELNIFDDYRRIISEYNKENFIE